MGHDTRSRVTPIPFERHSRRSGFSGTETRNCGTPGTPKNGLRCSAPLPRFRKPTGGSEFPIPSPPPLFRPPLLRVDIAFQPMGPASIIRVPADERPSSSMMETFGASKATWKTQRTTEWYSGQSGKPCRRFQAVRRLRSVQTPGSNQRRLRRMERKRESRSCRGGPPASRTARDRVDKSEGARRRSGKRGG